MRSGLPRADAGLLEGKPQEVMARLWYDFFRGLAKPFSSTEQTIASAGLLSVEHGQGEKPTRFWAVLVCEATEYGYAEGEEVLAPCFEDAGLDYGVKVYASATRLKAAIGANGIRVMRVDAGNEGQFATITPASWRIVLRCQ